MSCWRRDVAVKEVQVTGQATPAEAEVIYQRTLREARTAARLSHPSVVTVFDVVEESGSPWIVMELVEARSLDRVITEDGPLPPRPRGRAGHQPGRRAGDRALRRRPAPGREAEQRAGHRATAGRC